MVRRKYTRTLKPFLIYFTLLFGALLFTACQDSLNSMSGTPEMDGSSSDSLSEAPNHWYWADPLNVEESDVSDSEFKVFFDHTRMFGEPNMQDLGFTPIKVVTAASLWKESLSNIPLESLPDPDLLHQQTKKAAKVNPEIAVLDIEHWPNEGNYWDDVLPTVKKTYRVIDRMQKVRPNLKLGYFGIVPDKNFSHRLTKEVLSDWRHNNHNLRPLANKVNAFYLKGYTYWQDQEKWVQNLKNNIHEARRLAEDVGQPNKPVYVFLWPRYDWGFDFDSDLKGTYIEADYWRKQLDVARTYADGVVIWSSWGQQFDSSAPWWNVTTNFLEELGKAN